MQRKPTSTLKKQERRGDLAAAAYKRAAEKRERIIKHVQEAFKRVLVDAGIQVLCGANSVSGIIILDQQQRRFNLQTILYRHAVQGRICVKVYKAGAHIDEGGYSFLSDKPFYAWDSLKESRPHKAAILLAKKIELNTLYEVMET